jgi:hypothetical protein
MDKPQRIQRKRTKGYKTPPGTVYVGRPSRFGNPFRVGVWGTAQECVDAYRRWMDPHPTPENTTWRNSLYDDPRFDHHYKPYWGFLLMAAHVITNHLRGKNLSCWCKIGEPCHADILLEIANGEG